VVAPKPQQSIGRLNKVSWRERTVEECIKADDPIGLKIILEHGRRSWKESDNHGKTGLAMALQRNVPECAWVYIRMIEHHLSLNEAREFLNRRDRNERQSTPLHHASKHGLFEIVCKLLSLGADREREDGHGHYAQTIARNHHHRDLANFLSWKWFSKPWSIQIHSMTPFSFQKEVAICQSLSLFTEQCKDIQYLLFNELLTLHKLDYRNARNR
jgi:hypothetical protein